MKRRAILAFAVVALGRFLDHSLRDQDVKVSDGRMVENYHGFAGGMQRTVSRFLRRHQPFERPPLSHASIPRGCLKLGT